jgi:hypothetical protein
MNYHSQMLQLLLGSALLSLLHALIPNHWVPLVTVSRAEGWNRRESLLFSAVVAFAHIAGSIVIGLLLGLVGLTMSASFQASMRLLGPLILAGLGVYFVISGRRHARTCSHAHLHVLGRRENCDKPGSKAPLVLALALSMFFSPCLEIEAYFLNAGVFGWTALLAVAACFMVVTASLILLLVYVALCGIERFHLHFLDHHGRTLTGWVLVIFGAFGLFWEG